MRCPECGLDKEEIVEWLKELLRDAENQEICDVTTGLRRLLEHITGEEIDSEELWELR